MNQQSQMKWPFRIARLKLFRILFMSLVAVIVLLYVSVYESQQKTTDTGFWVISKDHKSQVKRIQSLWKPELLGEVNMHVFEDWCGSSVQQLRSNILYPLFPHTRTTISRLSVYAGWKNYGLRIFGYIEPRRDGEYIFAIASDDNSELWLSSDDSIEKIKLVAFLGKTGKEWAAPGEYGKFLSQISQPVMLLKRMRYYFEVLYKQSEGLDHLEVAWRRNTDDSNFEIITSEYLSRYVDESSLLLTQTNHIPETKASQGLTSHPISKQTDIDVDMVKVDPRDFIYRIPLLNDTILHNVFPKCGYQPIFVYDNTTIERYDGIYYVFHSSVYPNDYTRIVHDEKDTQKCFYKSDETFYRGGGFGPYMKIETIAAEERENKDLKMPKWKQIFSVKDPDFHSKQSDSAVNICRRAGNNIMKKKEVMPVIETIRNQLHRARTTSNLVIERVLNVERRANDSVGSRYLLELELKNKHGESFLLSKYFYNKGKSKAMDSEPPTLCIPQGFAWNPKAKVHVILTVKDQGRWVMHFLKEMEKVYKATGDKNFNIIITDYNSTDIDIEKELKKVDLPSYQFKRLHGLFGRSPGIQAGIDLVEDKNSILFLCDLHLVFPVTIIDSIRKHCVQGKMVFAPVVLRMDCGVTMHSPEGEWETVGYGLVAMYKSDMVKIGGMNVKEFTDKWGGEDWELLDRIVLNKLEVERLNLRNFLHYYHTRHGMWNSET